MTSPTGGRSPQPIDAQPQSLDHLAPEHVIIERNRLVHTVVTEPVELRDLAVRVEQPVFRDAGSFAFVVLLPAADLARTGTHHLDDQAGGTVEVRVAQAVQVVRSKEQRSGERPRS
ncbi:MAG: hypothetical protein M0R74_00640 [Dehalococcoidia bacterium]|nr:hypothetical protein [Dehalococcoidia bacterium]